MTFCLNETKWKGQLKWGRFMRRFMRCWWKVTRQTEPPRKLRRAGVQKGTTGNVVSAPWRPQMSLQSQWEGEERKKSIPKIYVFLQPKTRGRLNVFGRRLSFCKHRPQKWYQKTLSEIRCQQIKVMVFPHSDSGIWTWSPLILTGTLHDQMLNSRNTCRFKWPWRPQGWGHYMHYILPYLK